MAGDLTPGAIPMLLSGKYTATMTKPVVQVIEIKCTHTETVVTSNGVVKKKGWYEIALSDGCWVCQEVDAPRNVNDMITKKQLKKGSIVQLTRFSSNTDAFYSSYSYIAVYDLNVIHCNSIILGDPKPFPGNMTPSVENVIPPKLEEEPVDPDMNDHRHYADEHTTLKQKCSSCSQTPSRKRQRQSSDEEDDEIGACFEKLEKLGCGEGPMYDTAVLLFGESSDYRKIWLHLKPKSCLNWVKNAGSKYGLLG